MTEAVIEARGLAVAPAAGARSAVLHGLDLTVRRGEAVAVIGASGAGKTTLLLALAAAQPPRAGTLRLLGTEPWALSRPALQRLRGRLLLAPQVPPLPPRQRVVTAVLAGRLPQQGLWASLTALWSPREAPLAAAALAELDLADKLWQRVDRLSGGERQRVGLARALVSQAELWLVDEPLSALDPNRARRVIDTLLAAAAREGRTLVCSLHQVAVARERFARVLALRDGQLVYDGPGAGLDSARLQALYGQAGPEDTPEDTPAAAALADCSTPLRPSGPWC